MWRAGNQTCNLEIIGPLNYFSYKLKWSGCKLQLVIFRLLWWFDDLKSHHCLQYLSQQSILNLIRDCTILQSLFLCYLGVGWWGRGCPHFSAQQQCVQCKEEFWINPSLIPHLHLLQYSGDTCESRKPSVMGDKKQQGCFGCRQNLRLEEDGMNGER